MATALAFIINDNAVKMADAKLGMNKKDRMEAEEAGHGR